jgi:hypothetical protein
VKGIRFYKGTGNNGTHVGSLWTSAGTNLARATFTAETATGWQQVNFTTPVAMASNTTYIASYYAPVGHYAGDAGYFNGVAVTNSPLRALANNGEDGPNGVYAYGPSSRFPNQSFNAANYWVDLVFTASLGPAPTLTNITVTPVNPTVLAGGTQAFTATGKYSDASIRDVTSQVTWTSSSTGVATINGSGLATGVATGSTSIVASIGSVSANTTLTVQVAPLGVATSSLSNGTVNAAYAATLLASGGTLPYSWSLAGGLLPAGLTLNGSSGAISGTPTTTGTFNFTARVNDTSSPVQSVTKALSILVTAAPTTMGNTNDGTLTDAIGGGWINAGRFQATANLTVSTLLAKVGAITGRYKCAIYTDNASQPSRLLQSGAEVINPAAGWQSFPLTAPQALTNGQFYWLGIWSDNDGAQIYYSSAAGTIRWGNYNYGTWPDPIVTIGGASANYCIYAADTALASTLAATLDAESSHKALINSPGEPVILSIDVANTMISITSSAVAGRIYALEYVENLGDSNWVQLSPPVMATGSTVTLTDAAAANVRRFYRVINLSH